MTKNAIAFRRQSRWPLALPMYGYAIHPPRSSSKPRILSSGAACICAFVHTLIQRITFRSLKSWLILVERTRISTLLFRMVGGLYGEATTDANFTNYSTVVHGAKWQWCYSGCVSSVSMTWRRWRMFGWYQFARSWAYMAILPCTVDVHACTDVSIVRNSLHPTCRFASVRRVTPIYTKTANAAAAAAAATVDPSHS